MARVLHNSLKNGTVGYQFMLAQSGRVIYSRAWGKTKLDHIPALETDMTSRTQLTIGSVSKMITGVTMLKLQQQNKINLKNNLSNYLASGQYNSDSWVKTTSALNLLTYTTGFKRYNPGKCTMDDSTLRMDCSGFFNGTPDGKCEKDANGQSQCDYAYNNSDFRAARKVIEFKTGAKDSIDIWKETGKLWAESVDLNDMTCLQNPDAYYFGPCNGASDRFDYAGQSWRQKRQLHAGPTGWTGNCASGGWNASSRELIEFLGAIRYRKALDPTQTAQLLDANLKDIDGHSTALAWEPAWDADGEKNLHKRGGDEVDGVEAKAYISRLPNNWTL